MPFHKEESGEKDGHPVERREYAEGKISEKKGDGLLVSCARRTRSVKLCSFDARSESPAGYPLREQSMRDRKHDG